MDIFICQGDESALGAMIDQALNSPTNRQLGGDSGLRFELADRHVGFACIDVKRLLSQPVVSAGVPSLAGLIGVENIYARQTEVAVMVQVQDNTGLPYWYLPYVLNNLPTAVATGREIYGYPKQIAAFYADGVPDRGAGVLFGPERKWKRRVGVHAFDLKLPVRGECEFGLKNVLGFRRGRPASGLVLTTRQDATPRPHPEDFELYGRSPMLPIIAESPTNSHSDESSGTFSSAADGGEGSVAAAFRQRIRSDVPYVFLRQFRDPERENLASYQATVLGRLVPDPEDALEIENSEFTLVMPWAYNLALAKQVFNKTQKMTRPGIEPRAIEAPVVGVLTGRGATFSVVRASILWQFSSLLQVSEPGGPDVAAVRSETRQACQETAI